jgi:hypothetical protein
MAQSVHFRGVEAVIAAYRSNGVAPWAVISQKVIICSSDGIGTDDIDEGGAQLKKFLELMRRSGTEGACELCVYKLKEDDEIDSGSKYFRAFRFCLFENAYQGSNTDNRVVDQLKLMNERLVKLEGGDGDEDKTFKGRIGSMALGLMESPIIQQAIAGLVVGITKKIIPMGDKQQPAKVAGVVQPGDLSDEQKMKVHQAITRLAAKDANLGDHLLKLAEMAESDPGKYSLALKLL